MGLSGFFTPLCRYQNVFLDKQLAGDILWFDVPSAQVKFDHGDKALDRVLYLRHREERFRVCHEAIQTVVLVDTSEFQQIAPSRLLGAGCERTW